MATRERRKLMSTAARPGKSLQTTDPDQLADALASKLRIDTRHERAVAPPKQDSSKNSRTAAMRSINSAMQSLSELVKLGWRKSVPDGSSMWRTRNAQANSLSIGVSEDLGHLRKLNPGGLDVERAALSVVGKLIALEMYDAGRDALEQIHSPLAEALGLPDTPTPSNFNFIALYLPAALITEPLHLTLISTYLAYSLITACYSLSSSESLADLSLHLDSRTTPTLLSWQPSLASLGPKHLDPLLTRAYTALTKACATHSPVPHVPSARGPGLKTKSVTKPNEKSVSSSPFPIPAFTLRMYGLRCLVQTSPGTVEANNFWDQVVRFTNSFSKSCSSTELEENATTLVLASFETIVSMAECRSDASTFLDGEKFIVLCEYWISFAKRRGDICILDRIAMLMQKIPSSSANPIEATDPKTLKVDQPPGAPREIILEGTKLCAAFAQAQAFLEQSAASGATDDLCKSLKACLSLMQNSPSLSIFLLQDQPSMMSQKETEEFIRISGKVDRALERLRRGALKIVDSRGVESSTLRGAAQELLEAFVDSSRQLLTHKRNDVAHTTDLLTRTLDSLFILARKTLDTSNPQTYIPSYDYLNSALKICDLVATASGQDSTVWEVDVANYLRCISGAFYNLAGSLYQATRYGAAVPFMKEACSSGARALEGHRIEQSHPVSEKGKGKETERDAEWLQLEQQLYRRWELLAVCYLKNGDRRSSYDCFIKCIRAFPFATTSIASQSDNLCPSQILGPEASSLVKQLVSFLDRVTYVGACELLLAPGDVSLHSIGVPSPHTRLDIRILGVLLEYQYESLWPHRWKDGARAVLIQISRDLLSVYGTRDGVSGLLMPMRRARVLLRCMEFLYRDDATFDGGLSQLGFGTVEHMGQEILGLLSKPDLSHDVGLSVYRRQYKIATHLWLALHVHRQGHENQISLIIDRVTEASVLLKELQSETSSKSPRASKKISITPKVARKARSPRVVKVASPKVTRVTRQRIPAAPSKPPAAPRKPSSSTRTKAPVTPKPTVRAALQPISINAQRTPPRPSIDSRPSGAAMAFDDFDRFHDLLMLTIRILGLLSIVLPRVQLLVFLRKLCQQQLGSSSEAFILCSLELAYEYAKLGKFKKATSIFGAALDVVRSGESLPEVSALYLLRFSETLALFGDVNKSSSVYLEAFEQASRIALEHKGMSTLQRIQTRTRRLELAAMASYVFALIQIANEDVTTSMNALLQSLRLWNRAIDATSRLARSHSNGSSSSDSNPFEAPDANEDSSTGSRSTLDQPLNENPPKSRRSSTELEWRILEGLLSSLFSLADAYLTRGSPREAEYFLKQVQELAGSLNLPIIMGRVMSKMGEIHIILGRLQEAQQVLAEATAKLGDMPALDNINNHRILARYNERAEQQEDAQRLNLKTLQMLENLDGDFHKFDDLLSGIRRSLDPKEGTRDVIVPDLLATILSRCIWLLREHPDDGFHTLIGRLCALPPSPRIKAEESALMANLTLHDVHNRFRTDMFLSSLTESTIAIPMGMSGKNGAHIALPIQDVLTALDSAEKHFQASLALTAKGGNVVQARDAAVSLTLVKAFQTSLGRLGDQNSVYASSLLDASSAITLRREMLEAIQQKLTNLTHPDDLEWPLVTQDGTPRPRSLKSVSRPPRFALDDSDLDCDDADGQDNVSFVKKYWEIVQRRYQSRSIYPTPSPSSQTKDLPSNWTIIHVNLTEDKATLLISRQECGVNAVDPLVFCVPLNGRRDNGTGEEEEHLAFEDAVREFNDIIRLSDEGTKAAIHVKSDDEEARSNWWKQRNELDTRLKDLLDNIEFCWLGAFKTILSPRSEISTELLSELRSQFDKVFQRSLHVKDKKTKSRTTTRKKTVSQTQAPSQVTLDDTMLRCFSNLSPKCRDEELEDLVYFILDLYQFHGVPIAIAEVDALQVIIDLRTVLEEHNAKLLKHRKKQGGTNSQSNLDEHVFLVLDKNVQGLPWESLPSLRGRSVSRIPSIDFLHDRIEFANLKRQRQVDLPTEETHVDGSASLDCRNGYFILNPSGDLSRTEGRFRDWVEDMRTIGWDGVIGEPISELQFVDALKNRDIVVYFGHGGGEQYIRSHRVRSLPTCAATMLWGCSSGALREMGDFDRIGTPYDYMIGGCPTLIANLWDVTDRDIDKFTLSVFDKVGLKAKCIQQSKGEGNSTSIVAAVSQSRDSCKLKYLTGAAPVVYGIPFYL